MFWFVYFLPSTLTRKILNFIGQKLKKINHFYHFTEPFGAKKEKNVRSLFRKKSLGLQQKVRNDLINF